MVFLEANPKEKLLVDPAGTYLGLKK